jgi:hypothetical protein
VCVRHESNISPCRRDDIAVAELLRYPNQRFWDGDSEQVLTRVFDNEVTVRNVDESGTNFLLGVGGGVTLGKRWHIRLDYVYFGIDDDLLALGGGDDAYSDIATLQLHYRIGDGW